MVTLVIPGYSSHNKTWVEETAKNIKIEGQIRPIFWDHWTDHEKKFNAKEKARILSNISPNIIINIIAKSLGTLVASNIILNNPDAIGKVVLNGIPMNDMGDEDKKVISDALKSLPANKIVCILNNKDPHFDFNETKSFIKNANPEIKIISKDRDDHEYFYFEDFQKNII